MSNDAPSDTNPAPRKSGLVWKIVLLLLLSVAGLLGYIASRPNDYRVERSATMAATPEAIFEQVNNFHNWDHWSPWAKLDPNAKNSFSGPDAGEGAMFAWSGNDKVGEGSMTILASEPSRHLKIRLDFTKPMQDTATTEFHLEPAGDQTKVTWSMSGKSPNFAAKVICFFMNMEKMIGAEYEKGLANLRRRVESGSGS